MYRLTCIREREQGAIAMIVAMLFGFGVMLGLAALTIDVGNINADRRQLQNGADAVALAVAQQCATDGTCDVATPSKIDNLQKLADANAADNATSIRRVDDGVNTPLYGKPAICGTLAGLPPCPTSWTDSSSMSNLQECPSKVADGVNYVRVYAETENSDHQNILPYYFGAAITGIKGANQQACASVAMRNGYGAPAAVADASCAWDAATSNTPKFPPEPPYFYPSPLISDPPNASPLGPVPVDAKYVVKVLMQGATNSSTDPATCGKTTSGQYMAGNFGWLNVKSGTTCTANLSSDEQTVGGNSGGPPPNSQGADCTTYFNSMIGKIIYIPIFTGTPSGTGSNTVYTIDGVSAFFLAGWQAPSAGGGMNVPTPAYDATLPANPTPHCIATGNGHDGGCLWGWYLSKVVPAGSISEGTGRGPILLGLNG